MAITFKLREFVKSKIQGKNTAKLLEDSFFSTNPVFYPEQEVIVTNFENIGRGFEPRLKTTYEVNVKGKHLGAYEHTLILERNGDYVCTVDKKWISFNFPYCSC
jgi:hypothetical protein